MTRLGDICRFQSGGTPPKNDPKNYGGNIPWITTVALNGSVIDGNNAVEWITEEAIHKSAAKIVPANSIMVGTRVGVGKVAINGIPMSTSQDIISLIDIDETKWDKKYLCKLILANNDYLNAQARGATIKGIKIDVLAGIKVPSIPVEEQRTVSAVIERIDSIISLRKKQLQKLDNLIKTRFVEMFGDPQVNTNKWNEVSVASVIKGNVSNGFFAKRDDYHENGNVSVLGVANVVNRMYSQVLDLPKTNATQRDIQRFSVKYGDLLFCRSSLVASGIGKASIVPEDVPENVLFECHVIRLPLDLTKCVPEYVQALTTTDYYRKQIIAQSKTATMTTIGQDGILKTKILLPPIERQQEFYRLLKRIDELKEKAEQGLEKLEQMKQALMQKYFGRKGEAHGTNDRMVQ